MNSPQMQVGQVEMVSLEWVMQNTTHSADYYQDEQGVNYYSMMIYKSSDPGFGDLLWTMYNDGFRVPIVLDIGHNGEGTITLGNGHHRTCAAILLGLDTIPVYWAEDNYMSTHASTGGRIEEGSPWEGLEKESYEWF